MRPIERFSAARYWLMALMLVLLIPPSIPAAPAAASGTGTPQAFFPNGRRFRLEIARTIPERARGYMFRERVGPREGMLFLFPESDFHSFWMKNCRLPLDIIWLAESLKVVHLEGEVPPCRQDPCPGYSPMRKALYVLEVRAGACRKSGLRVGDPIRLEGVLETEPEAR